MPAPHVCDAANDAVADGIELVSIGVGTDVDRAWLSSISEFYYASDFTQLDRLVQRITQAACADIEVAVDCQSSASAIVGDSQSSTLSIKNEGPFSYTTPLSFIVTTETGLQGLTVQPSAGTPPGAPTA
jgi:hypothetical protein